MFGIHFVGLAVLAQSLEFKVCIYSSFFRIVTAALCETVSTATQMDAKEQDFLS